jgi:interleukin-1 receptor-associated kinase 1
MNQNKESARGWFGQLTDIALEYPYSELAAACGSFCAEAQLGEGAAGAVYSGVLRGGTKVAVKVLPDRGGLEGFEEEVRVLSRFRHPNLVTLLGWGQHKSNKYLVYELLPGGDLQGKLQKSREGKAPFVWQQRLHATLGAATGLSHMMSGQLKVFHRDIKPANILLEADGTAKMADFGLAGVLHQEGLEYMSVDAISGTPGYACPAYVLSGHVNEQSEVYSFGTVLLELLVNRPPCLCSPEGDMMFPLLSTVQPAVPGAHGRLLSSLDPTAGSWPRSIIEELADLSLACVDMAPERRPNFEGICRVLRRLCRCAADWARSSSGGARGGG